MRGSISIFVSLVMTCVLTLTFAISESARLASVKAKCKANTQMAADSVMAGYSKEIFEDYGILAAWEREPANLMAKRYIDANLKGSDDIRVINFDAVESCNVNVTKTEYVTDNGGRIFKKQICDYAMIAGPLNLANTLMGVGESLDESEEYEEESEDLEGIDEMEAISIDVRDRIISLKDGRDLKETLLVLREVYEEYINAGEQDGMDASIANVAQSLEMLVQGIDEEILYLISRIDEYISQKGDYLRAHGESYTKDYIDRDRDIFLDVKRFREEMFFPDNITDNPGGVTPEYYRAYIDDIQYVSDRLGSLEVVRPSPEDERNRSIFESVQSFIKEGMLSLVVDDTSKLSNKSIEGLVLPSSAISEDDEETAADEMKNKAMLAVYADLEFNCYTDINQGKATKDGSNLNYEMEYLVAGGDNDKDNLLSCVNRIVLFRNAMNIVAVLKDSAKMGEIETMASSAAAAMGLLFLEPIIKGILIEGLALAEATTDARLLLDGKKVALIKDGRTWRCSFTNLRPDIGDGDENGVSYKTILEGAMLLTPESEVTFRTMDLVELGIRTKYNRKFKLSECFEEIEIEAEFNVNSIFPSMGLARKDNYAIVCNAESSY